MLTSDKRQHIDAARQVLVGVVPNPTSQIDQITNALIYKFMDDMDQAAIKAGDEPSFFVGELERYAWSRLMDPRLGNQEKMNLYGEALIKFSESKQLPQLFRDIFRQAYLPYRQPEVLGLFLQEINFFDYSHPEELGNAYEYLLSIMSSQGDAGQFRTPRHIIDFIVEVVDPSKDDKVLDPACGTGGFLVSAYKHIASKHDGKNVDGTPNREKPLTPDDRRKLMQNFEGYDVDPGMVRIAQVNMYLHQFKNPKIYNYNTLSSEERWNDKFDVMLANPPFMSPKGGVETHSKFSVQSSRSEVLFVDYIMHHLRPKGRAGIIVPEGIIFQSGLAYKQLRKNLVEDGLFAVVSLPSGVFNPYAGVKTSILLFDAEMGRQQKEILFVKIENDGFDLGAQRREKAGSNLPEAARVLFAWRNGEKIESKLAQWVSREKIAETGDYNLSGDRYRVAVDYSNAKWPMVELKDLCDITTGRKDVNQSNPNGEYPFFTCAKENTFIDDYSFDTEALLIAGNGDVGAVKYYKGKFDAYQRTYVLSNFRDINAKYLFHILNNSLKESMQLQKLGNTMPYIKLGMLETFKVPFPPFEIQERIVAELDGYESIITGAKQITESWKPRVDIDPRWKMVKLGEIVDLVRGVVYSKADEVDSGGYKVLRAMNITLGGNVLLDDVKQISKKLKLKDQQRLKEGDIFICLASGSKNHVGKVAYIEEDTDFYFGGFMGSIRVNKEDVIPRFVYFCLRDWRFNDYLRDAVSGANINNLNAGILGGFEIPLPPLTDQKKIVDKIETERTFIEGNKRLIEIYEQKTKEVLEGLWNK